jgi:hypothetical protein
MHVYKPAAYCPRPAQMRYRYLLGVKWSQVQILSARPQKGHLTLYLRKRRPGLLLGPVPTPQLLTLAINDARVDGQLIADNRLAPGAAS